MSRSTWRPMLRYATRAARRSPGRTVLIAVLIALPVFGAVAVDLLIRTDGPPPAERARFHFGAADGLVSVTDQNTVEPFRDWGPEPGFYMRYDSESPPERDPASVNVAELLPPDTRLIDAPAVSTVSVRYDDRKVSWTPLRQMDGTDPLIEPMLDVRDGRYPEQDGEVALTPALADRLDITEPGATIRLEVDGRDPYEADPKLDTDTDFAVVGIVEVGSDLFAEDVLAAPRDGGTVSAGLFAESAEGEPVKEDPGAAELSARHYLVDWPEDLSFEQARSLAETAAASGVSLLPRSAMLNRDRWLRGGDGGPSLGNPSDLAIGVLIVGFGLLEIVLLAGAAFAVGIRRQTRELGLVAVTGGDTRDVRRVVLAQGLVLGTLGGFAGVLAGVAVPMLATPWVERLIGHDISVWGFAPIDYAVFASVGVLAGLAAAAIPAIGAGRMQPIAALAGRFRTSSGVARPPKLGLALMATGIAATVVGGAQVTARLAAYEKAKLDTPDTMPPNVSLPTMVGVGGLVLLTLGLVRMMPAIVSWVGALARRLPPTLRMAARDGSRHRHRTAPAAAAIMITVAASTGLAFGFASVEADQRAEYRPSWPNGWASAGLDTVAPRIGQAVDGSVRAEIAAALPSMRQHSTAYPADVHGVLGGEPIDPESDSWEPVSVIGSPDPDYPDQTRTMELMVLEPETLRAMYGEDADPAVDALEAGRILILPEPWLEEAQRDRTPWIEKDSVLLAGTWTAAEDPDGRTEAFPATEWEPPELFTGMPTAIVTSEAARGIGLELLYQPGLVLEPVEPLTDGERDRAVAALEDQGGFIFFEEGYVSAYWIGYLIVGGAAGLVTIVAIAIAVALSHAESRPDLATLAAVGAPPARRRGLAAGQAILVGGLGCLVGVGLGIVFGQLLRAAANAPSLVVPWTHLMVTAVGVPIFAVLCAALLTRSRLPMVRRLE